MKAVTRYLLEGLADYTFWYDDKSMGRLVVIEAKSRDTFGERIPQLTDGAWCSADGMSTGLVFFQCTGVKATGINLLALSGTGIEAIESYTERVFDVFGPVRGESAVEGICRAPIVEEGSPLQGL